MRLPRAPENPRAQPQRARSKQAKPGGFPLASEQTLIGERRLQKKEAAQGPPPHLAAPKGEMPTKEVLGEGVGEGIAREEEE